MSTMNKKVKTGALSAVAVIVLICLFRFTSAYFVDRETSVNVIKIGRIDVELDEGYTPPDNTLPGRIFDKAPKLKNTGTKDEFVFLEVTVPKEKVTLLYETETTVEESTKKVGEIRKEKAEREIFRMIANYDEGVSKTVIPNTQFNTTSPENTVDYDIDFSYHAPVVANASTEPPIEAKDGWILIEADNTKEDVNSYVFAYNKKLSPNTETVTLFDKVQLKSFINGEVTGEKIIGIQPYAIQADGLKAAGLAIDSEIGSYNPDGSKNKDDLKIIYQVIQRKAASN